MLTICIHQFQMFLYFKSVHLEKNISYLRTCLLRCVGADSIQSR